VKIFELSMGKRPPSTTRNPPIEEEGRTGGREQGKIRPRAAKRNKLNLHHSETALRQRANAPEEETKQKLDRTKFFDGKVGHYGKPRKIRRVGIGTTGSPNHQTKILLNICRGGV